MSDDMEISSPRTKKSTNSKRAPRPKPANPIEAAIKSWLEELPTDFLHSIQVSVDDLLAHAPRRWVVYAPMVLLPSGSFQDECWTKAGIPAAEPSHLHHLWIKILHGIGKTEGKGILTHLAVNAAIPLRNGIATGSGGGEDPVQNILRTPSGLITLLGDFGPELSSEHSPTAGDFEEAFWVCTKQNGITQVWAPRYTMFSRGNVKEKARLLDFHKPDERFETRGRENRELGKVVAVDLYAGIGYFVFSYIRMGMGRVVGWELNPWSVEGLRRGAVANGWSVKVVAERELLEFGDEKIVVLLEDNGKAAGRLKATHGQGLGKVSHVNCGLLPTSEGSWKMALDILNVNGWLHLHENVGVRDVEYRNGEIEGMLRSWLEKEKDERRVKVEHVEFVKTFAPGVWHCVFDMYISSN